MAKTSQRNDRARVYGSPGERPRLAGLVRAAWPAFVVIGLAGYLLRAVLPGPPIGPALAGFLFLALAAALAIAATTSRVRIESFVKGARGEERVARELSFLPAGYDVFHGLARSTRTIMGRAGDFDHVVVGPNGVFLVETKNWSGRVTVDGERLLVGGGDPDRSPVAQVRDAAVQLTEWLAGACEAEVSPQPVVCFASDALAADRATAGGVTLCNARSVNAVILEAPGALQSETRARISAHLRQRLE